MKLRGQRALVTGGTAGIGRAIAQALLARGNEVMVCGRNEDALERVRAELPGIAAVRADIAQVDDLRKLAAQAEIQLGGLTLLVNNAGIQLDYDIARTPTEEVLANIDAEVRTNLVGLAQCTALMLPLLRREREAAIVNVSSGLAIVPKKSAPLYSATKAAVRSFSKVLRWQLAELERPIRVHEVLPPMVDTAMTAGRGSEKLTPGEMARRMLRGVERGSDEIPVGQVKLLIWLNRFVPGVAEKIMRGR